MSKILINQSNRTLTINVAPVIVKDEAGERLENRSVTLYPFGHGHPDDHKQLMDRAEVSDADIKVIERDTDLIKTHTVALQDAPAPTPTDKPAEVAQRAVPEVPSSQPDGGH